MRVGAGLSPARDRRDHRHLVAVLESGRGIRVRPVAREPDEVAAGAKRGILLHERVPGVRDRGVGRHVEGHLARPGELALDREQADPDAHRASRATWR